jgi:hypothetical protein
MRAGLGGRMVALRRPSMSKCTRTTAFLDIFRDSLLGRLVMLVPECVDPVWCYSKAFTHGG